MREQLISKGYTLNGLRSCAFPIHTWTLDLEVQHEVALSASERTVLRLAREGFGTTEALAAAMGFGADTRVVASAATRLLEAGGLAIIDQVLTRTTHGDAMLSTARLARSDRVVQAVYYSALDRRWSWRRPERLLRQVDLTIELASPVARPIERQDEIRRLIRASGVPELAERYPGGKSPAVELLGFREEDSSVVYEHADLERWISDHQAPSVWIGIRDGEVDERLSRMLDGARFQEKRKRLGRPEPTVSRVLRRVLRSYPRGSIVSDSCAFVLSPPPSSSCSTGAGPLHERAHRGRQGPYRLHAVVQGRAGGKLRRP